jgi:hypothetical protein
MSQDSNHNTLAYLDLTLSCKERSCGFGIVNEITSTDFSRGDARIM